MTDSEKLDLILHKISSLEEGMQHLQNKQAVLEQHQINFEQRLDNLEQRLDHFEQRLDNLEQRQINLEQRQTNLEQAQKELHNDLRSMKLHLENVTDNNIRIIAEGHTDLARMLDEALKVENERELLLVRMNCIQDEVREIKEKLTVA